MRRTPEQAMRVLRGGKGADLLLVDVALDIRDLVMRLEVEHIHVPIVACGITNDARAAVAAIHAGAKEYIPLPPDPELIAAVLAAVANDSAIWSTATTPWQGSSSWRSRSPAPTPR